MQIEQRRLQPKNIITTLSTTLNTIVDELTTDSNGSVINKAFPYLNALYKLKIISGDSFVHDVEAYYLSTLMVIRQYIGINTSLLINKSLLLKEEMSSMHAVNLHMCEFVVSN